jgi:hypothetical protein
MKEYDNYVIYIFNNVTDIFLNKNTDRLWEYDNLVLKIGFSKIKKWSRTEISFMHIFRIFKNKI